MAKKQEAHPSGAKDQLDRFLQAFRSLNPQSVWLMEDELFRLAEAGVQRPMQELLQFGDQLLMLYLDSPIKREQRAIMTLYFKLLDKTAQKLIKAGELPDTAAVQPSETVALVPRQLYSWQDYNRLVAASKTPVDIIHAADACRRRNDLVGSVLEPYFIFLQKVDRDRAFEWELSLCNHPSEPLDPDVSRDLLRAWGTEENLPVDLLKRVLDFCHDARVLQHWPVITRESDRILRTQGLHLWCRKNKDLNLTEARQLRRLAPFQDDRKIMRWLKRTLIAVGDRVAFFTVQSESLLSTDGERAEWRQKALYPELVWLQSMLPPILFALDMLLYLPNGAFELSRALFGFTSDYREAWETRLEEKCRDIVRRAFLLDLKAGRRPTETIHRLCFGDPDFEEEIMKELDYVTHKFDSIEQRETVVRKLATIYRSYREPSLITAEIGRRYRRMMKVLHGDNLNQVLTDEQYEAISTGAAMLADLGDLASASRKFLNMYRALDRSTDDIIDAEQTFTQNVRNLRSAYFRRLLT